MKAFTHFSHCYSSSILVNTSKNYTIQKDYPTFLTRKCDHSGHNGSRRVALTYYFFLLSQMVEFFFGNHQFFSGAHSKYRSFPLFLTVPGPLQDVLFIARTLPILSVTVIT